MEVGTTNVNLSTRSVCSCSQKCGLCSVLVVNKPTTSFLSCSQRDAGDVNSTHDISVLHSNYCSSLGDEDTRGDRACS